MSKNRLYDSEKERRKLLLLKPEFITDIIKFRKKYKIPPSGIGNSYDDFTKFNSLLAQEADSYHQNQRKTRIKQLLEFENNNQFLEAHDLKELINSENPQNSIINDTNELCKKYGIPCDLSAHMFQYFLISGDEDDFVNNLFIASFEPIVVNQVNNKTLSYVDLRIYKNTRLADVERLWPEVIEYQKSMVGNNKQKSIASNLIDRDIEIYKLKVSGKTTKEIAPRFNMTYSEVDTIFRNTKIKISNS
ncbi:MAG: hypothetical protein WCP11_03040 [Candidatus Saccharibacteria bacterium]